MLVRLLVASLLLAHALIHIAFVAPPPPVTADGPTWPFSTGQSWLVARFGADAARLLALALVVATIAGFALAALVAIGLLPAALWQPVVVIGCVASLALLAAFFHPWLLLGVAIDVGLLWATLVTGWIPASSEAGL